MTNRYEIYLTGKDEPIIVNADYFDDDEKFFYFYRYLDDDEEGLQVARFRKEELISFKWTELDIEWEVGATDG